MLDLALSIALCLSSSLSGGTAIQESESTNEPVQETEVDQTETGLQALEGWKWREVGPYRGGRSAAVAGLAADKDTYYFGSAGGGVWKTGDGGRNWKNISDGFFGGSIGAVAVSEWDPNVVYVGGGEKTVRGNVSHGDGVWRSTDAGKTWATAGLPDSRHISRLRIHPKDPDTVYAAVMGHLFGPNHERGVFRSKDGGENWEHVLFKGAEVGCVDLALDPTNPRILYASFWRVLRQPWTLESGGEGSSLWKSVDGGDTWAELTSKPGMPKGTWGISGVSVSRTNPENVYAIIEAKEGGVYRSRDGGETWSRTNKQRSLRQRAWYYSRIFADPTDENSVYVLNVQMHRSTDGGRSFSTIRTPHGDNHDLWIDPNDGQRMIESNDGGANVSYDGGRNWSPQDNQPTSQMYRVSVDDDFPYRLLGGQQDNSALRIRSRSLRSSVIGERDWDSTAGGESGHIAAQPGNPDVVYGGSYGGTLTRYNHGTGERRSVHIWPDNPIGWGAAELKYRFNWNFPLFFSPHSNERLYAAANVLFRTDNGGASWDEISPDLTRNDKSKMEPSGGPLTKDNTSVEYYGTIFAACEGLQAGVLWTGSDDGKLFLSRDDGANWSDVTPSELPEWAQINCVEAHASNPGGLYLAATLYKLDDFEPYLFKTQDWGVTWQRIDTGIARDHFTRAIRTDPGREGLLYAGTERGIYVSLNDGERWDSLQLDLPIVPVTDLAVQSGDLIAATQGRGFWILDDLTPLHTWALESEASLETARLFAPRATHRLSARGGSGRGRAGSNPSFGAVFSYLIPEGVKRGAVSLEIMESDGTVIQTFTAGAKKGEKAKPRSGFASDNTARLSLEPGLNRFAWNLRYPGAETVPGMILWNGGFAGPRAVPGNYRAALVIAGKEEADSEQRYEVEFSVEPDPRSATSVADLREQFELLILLREDLNGVHRGLRKLRDIRGQVGNIKKRIKGQESYEELSEAAKQLSEKLTEVEKALYQTKNESAQDPLNFPIRLGDKLAGLRRNVDTGDYAPTAQSRAVRDELMQAIDVQLSELERIQSEDLKAFNEMAMEARVPAVLPMPDPKATDDDDEDDEGEDD